MRVFVPTDNLSFCFLTAELPTLVRSVLEHSEISTLHLQLCVFTNIRSSYD